MAEQTVNGMSTPKSVTPTGTPAPRSTVPTNVATASKKPDTEKKEPAYTLKIVQSKVHLGPKKEGLKTRTDLSSATGKLLFNNNMKVVIKGKGDAKSENSNGSTSSTPSNSVSINLTVGKEVQQAAFALLAWDYLYKIGTDAYIEKFEALQQARIKAYQDLGISNPGSERPELTSQQREVYNAKVRPFAFTYFEYKLSFKQPGKKAVRSKTFRSLKPLDATSIQKQLKAKIEALSKDIEFGVRKNNVG